MPSPSGSTARPHHLCAFPVTAPGCVPCCEMPEAIRAAPATNPSRAAAAAPSLPASLLRRVGKLPPRPTLRRQQPVSRGGGGSHPRLCQEPGGAGLRGAPPLPGPLAVSGQRRRCAAEGRCGAVRSGTAPGPLGARPGPCDPHRAAAKRGVKKGGVGGRGGGTAVLPHLGAEKCRFLLHLQFCPAGWLGFVVLFPL